MSSSTLSLEALFSVKGYVAVVTGGGTGLGYWFAEALVQNGATVYITGRRGHVLMQAAEKLNAMPHTGGQAIPFSGDMSSKEDVKRLVEFVTEREQGVDLVINNAGAVIAEAFMPFEAPLSDLQSAFWSSPEDAWITQFTANTWGPYLVTTGFLQLLSKSAEKGNGRGSVIIVSSAAARMWNPHGNVPGYILSKIAVEQLAKIFAAKLYPYGIRLNVLAPGSFPTELNNPENPYSLSNAANNANIPMGRSGAAEDIVGSVIWLASRAGAYVTGSTIDVDGGLLLVANGTNRITPLVETSIPTSRPDAGS